MVELVRACDALMQHFNEDEGGELVSFVYLIKQKITRSYDDVDDFAASVAISKLQTD
ncbi:MAG: hypothetical protein ABIU05_19360 [Nitrospirales bacterium]